MLTTTTHVNCNNSCYQSNNNSCQHWPEALPNLRDWRLDQYPQSRACPSPRLKVVLVGHLATESKISFGNVTCKNGGNKSYLY